ncbi:hypothetical protein SAMN05444339_1185 [Loktanella atrilutea]|uniref:Probable inorganic carbon transporter subunit DabA n=1 Tax=Loktanella atrilutea TaxID=366533 RepID=A0A1M5F860_LOKAT|nr:DUF2309 domain-containing protein [Loktanella atrilutea]SHF87659.1 hypothetical protein SAMN05444339_1185 [Loktanella atrilutea]
MNAHMSWPGQTLELFAAAQAAIDQVPPAFPLAATVAVNPWFGQSREDRTVAAARLLRVGGGRMFLPRDTVASMIGSGEVSAADLTAAADTFGIDPKALRYAADESVEPATPLPCVADLAQARTGINWSALIEERFGLWAAGHFDRGQAFWPAPDGSAWTSWRGFASRDLTPGLAGLAGFPGDVAATPTDAQTAFSRACEDLGLKPESAPMYFHRLLMTLSGWAQYARHFGWIAARDGGHDGTLFDLLTVRLIWEVAILDRGGAPLAADWGAQQAAFAAKVTIDAATVLDAALQEAVDRSAERRLADQLAGADANKIAGRPSIQAAFCIDVRSEVFRRALETQDPQIQTIGFAGFFGLAVRHKGHASDITEMRAPILLSPSIESRTPGTDTADRVRLRTMRAWGRFKRAAVSAFAFVEAAGPLYVGKLIRDSLGLTGQSAQTPLPAIDLGLDDRVKAAAGILRAMSLTDGFARLVLICGHGSAVTNAPHASVLQCGACGGHAGDVNARLLAALLNDADVRQALVKNGIAIPADTHFVAGLHDTVSDNVHVFDDAIAPTHRADRDALCTALARAGSLARTERALTLPRGRADELARRGRDWSELRPEWGLAGCQGFIAAPRSRTSRCDLGGRIFLHDYDWRRDDGAATLELILSAPVVVASWIALQYHGSAIAPETFGAGNKLLHNVVGGIGVLEGNGGALRAGLPWQSVHDGTMARHDPSRLVVAVEAPEEMISQVRARQPDVRALFEKGWLTLVTIDATGHVRRRYEQSRWTDRVTDPVTVPTAA